MKRASLSKACTTLLLLSSMQQEIDHGEQATISDDRTTVRVA